MKRRIVINKRARIAHIPKEIIDEGLYGVVEGYADAVTLTLVKPGTSLRDVERSLEIVLKDVQFRRQRDKS